MVCIRILSLKIEKHETLGDLFLDFSNDDIGANSIVIAGDNGTGKSTILKIIESLLNNGNDSVLSGNISLKFGYSSTEEKKYYLDLLKKETKEETFKRLYDSVKKINLENHFYINFSVATHKNTFDIRENFDSNYNGYSLYYLWIKIINKSIFVNNDHVSLPQSVNNISKSELNDVSNFGIENEQLLVDINNQDNNEIIAKVEEEDYEINKSNLYNSKKRISIFTNAFNTFFRSNNLSFKKIDSKHKILFQKHGKEFSAENFSKGENQIFNMACQILKNSLMLWNIIIIDEPENGLHPEWQIKLLNYYRELANGKQIIISTHSPFIINSLFSDDKLLILKREGDVIKVDEENQYYSIGEVTIVSKAMELIKPQDDVIKIVVAGITDKIYLDRTIELWREEFPGLEQIKIIYELNSKRGGDGGDDNLLKMHERNSLANDKNIFFLYDHDIEKKIEIKAEELNNYKKMKLTSEIKIFSNFDIQEKNKLSGIENFIRIEDNEITPRTEKTFTKYYDGRDDQLRDVKVCKKTLADFIVRLDEGDLKNRLEKLKDFLVDTFINNFE